MVFIHTIFFVTGTIFLRWYARKVICGRLYKGVTISIVTSTSSVSTTSPVITKNLAFLNAIIFEVPTVYSAIRYDMEWLVSIFTTRPVMQSPLNRWSVAYNKYIESFSSFHIQLHLTYSFHCVAKFLNM